MWWLKCWLGFMFDSDLLDMLSRCKSDTLSVRDTLCLPVGLFNSNFPPRTIVLVLSVLFYPPPFVVNSARASLQHFNLFCCSPSLKAAALNASSPPWLFSVDSTTPQWLPATMAFHKGLGSILHQIPAGHGDSCSKFHSPTEHTQLHTHTHILLFFDLAVIFTLYFGKRKFQLFCRNSKKWKSLFICLHVEILQNVKDRKCQGVRKKVV